MQTDVVGVVVVFGCDIGAIATDAAVSDDDEAVVVVVNLMIE